MTDVVCRIFWRWFDRKIPQLPPLLPEPAGAVQPVFTGSSNEIMPNDSRTSSTNREAGAAAAQAITPPNPRDSPHKSLKPILLPLRTYIKTAYIKPCSKQMYCPVVKGIAVTGGSKGMQFQVMSFEGGIQYRRKGLRMAATAAAASGAVAKGKVRGKAYQTKKKTITKNTATTVRKKFSSPGSSRIPVTRIGQTDATAISPWTPSYPTTPEAGSRRSASEADSSILSFPGGKKGQNEGHSDYGKEEEDDELDDSDDELTDATLARNELDNNRSISVKEVDAVFEGTKPRALKTAGEQVKREKGGLPRGVRKTNGGQHQARIGYSGTNNSKTIGTFDTPEQASAAYTLVRNELDKNRSISAMELDAVFEAAKARALITARTRAGGRVRAQAGEAGHGRLRALTKKREACRVVSRRPNQDDLQQGSSIPAQI